MTKKFFISIILFLFHQPLFASNCANLLHSYETKRIIGKTHEGYISQNDLEAIGRLALKHAENWANGYYGKGAKIVAPNYTNVPALSVYNTAWSIGLRLYQDPFNPKVIWAYSDYIIRDRKKGRGWEKVKSVFAYNTDSKKSVTPDPVVLLYESDSVSDTSVHKLVYASDNFLIFHGGGSQEALIFNKKTFSLIQAKKSSFIDNILSNFSGIPNDAELLVEQLMNSDFQKVRQIGLSIEAKSLDTIFSQILN